ncbi:MAG: hypothetical protein JW791_00025 [Nanoarchaeota archaeon]|nr:hypothetical protein [Nanoarchaeota archaeon]
MVFKKNWVKEFLQEHNNLINIIFGTIIILIIILFYNISIDYCSGVNSLVLKLLEDNSYCIIDSDCTVYPALTSDCEMPASCALSLNQKTKPYYFNYLIINLKTENCPKDCTSVCADTSFLTPVCLNNVCDFKLP